MRIGIAVFVLSLLMAFLPGMAQDYLQYTNEDWGFKISYPSDWTVEEDVDYIMIYAPYEDMWDVYTENVTITMEELPYPMNLDDYVDEALAQLQDFVDDFTLIGIYDDTVSGKPAKIVAYAGSTYGYYLVFSQVVLIEGKKAYVLTFTAEPEKVDLYADIFDKILSSFTLLRAKPAPRPPIRPPLKPPVGGKETEEPEKGEKTTGEAPH